MRQQQRREPISGAPLAVLLLAGEGSNDGDYQSRRLDARVGSGLVPALPTTAAPAGLAHENAARPVLAHRGSRLPPTHRSQQINHRLL